MTPWDRKRERVKSVILSKCAARDTSCTSYSESWARLHIFCMCIFSSQIFKNVNLREKTFGKKNKKKHTKWFLQPDLKYHRQRERERERETYKPESSAGQMLDVALLPSAVCSQMAACLDSWDVTCRHVTCVSGSQAFLGAAPAFTPCRMTKTCWERAESKKKKKKRF